MPRSARSCRVECGAIDLQSPGATGTLGGMESDKWVELVWLEGPDARPRDWGRYLWERYPDLSGYRDGDFRIEAFCGRDGVDRVRLSRRTEPTERPPRKKRRS